MVKLKPWRIGKENAMLQAWLWKHHRQDIQWRRVRLGVLPTKESNKMYACLLRWADAIFIKDGVVNIVEAKLRPDLGALGQLEGYKVLFSQTLEFSQYKEFPVRMILLTTMIDLVIVELCSKKEIAYEVFTLDDVNKVRTKLMQPVI